MRNFWQKYREYIISIAIALAVGALAAWLTRDSMQDYAALEQPPLSPPGWLFPIVWTILYTLMGISAGLVWKSDAPGANTALFIYYVQLAVNFVWPIFYFVFGARLVALVWLFFLLILVMIMIKQFYDISPKAAVLQIPYVLWLLFAAYLNFGTYILNR